MNYTLVKLIHIVCVVLSGTLFSVRGGLSLCAIDWRRWRVLRWLPHFVDTILLCSAITLCVLIHQYPMLNAWLTAKVFALIAYIILGSMALKREINKTTRAMYFLAALACFVYILGVARMHHWHSWLLALS